ncbi:hypothetical protein P7K49_031223 [Saguinus oedipus]|uniref:Uncharacterized protein n=1 Tax=Saguinus oedipus TaxID=9490 RepID=A0ABQ9U4E4_SAGOE|nr:hypothetical protein P7K49_031223 [Saguinus oedipus]
MNKSQEFYISSGYTKADFKSWSFTCTASIQKAKEWFLKRKHKPNAGQRSESDEWVRKKFRGQGKKADEGERRSLGPLSPPVRLGAGAQGELPTGLAARGRGAAGQKRGAHPAGAGTHQEGGALSAALASGSRKGPPPQPRPPPPAPASLTRRLRGLGRGGGGDGGDPRLGHDPRRGRQECPTPPPAPPGLGERGPKPSSPPAPAASFCGHRRRCEPEPSRPETRRQRGLNFPSPPPPAPPRPSRGRRSAGEQPTLGAPRSRLRHSSRQSGCGTLPQAGGGGEKTKE